MNRKEIENNIYFESIEDPKILRWLQKNRIKWWIKEKDGVKWKIPTSPNKRRIHLTIKQDLITKINIFMISTEKDLIGKSIKDEGVIEYLKDKSSRVVREDGIGYAVTADFKPTRLNFHIEEGLITKINHG